jgi:hypothetical protein
MRTLARVARLHAFWLALVLGLPLSAGAQTTPAPAPTVIVPGYAIGPWSLDMSFADLVWDLGIRTVSLNHPGPQFRGNVTVDEWASPPVVAVHGPADNAVEALGISAPGYRTREQVGVGATEDQVVAAYGQATAVIQPPSRSKLFIYDNLGLAFDVSFDAASGQYGAVDRVFVFRPGQAADVWQISTSEAVTR